MKYMPQENNKTGQAYQKELFARLKSSISLKKEEESFGVCLKSSTWWLLEKPEPTKSDLEKAIGITCYYSKRPGHRKEHCANNILVAVRKAAKEKTLTKYLCVTGLHGFVYPIVQGDKLYGYIGVCYHRKDISPQVLDIFGAFTDTIVREIQKELELSKLYETIRPRAIALSTVHTVYRLISSTLDLNELLPRIARLCLQIIRANRCSIKLVNYTKKVLIPKVAVDLREKKSQLKRVKIGRWAPGKAVKYGKAIRGDTYLAVPLIDEEVIGVITLYDKVDNKPFTQFDQEIMTTLSEQAVIAIKNAELYREQEKLTIGVIKSLSTILKARSPGVYIPRASFMRIAVAIGQILRLDSSELKNLEYAVLLHDAGQIIIPDDVLKKPTQLTGSEYDLVKEHPMRGVEIVKHIGALKAIIPYILYHHENFDGTGYPKGLKGPHIPLGARIMALVAAFESMVAKKPYRIAKSIDEAIEEIKRNSGTQFDPDIVDAFLKVMARKDIRAMLTKETYEEK